MRHRSQQYVYRPASYTEASENGMVYILCCEKKKIEVICLRPFISTNLIYAHKICLLSYAHYYVPSCVCVFVTVQNLLFIHAALSLDHKYHSFIHTLLLSLCVGCIGYATSHILVFHCVCRQIEEWRETVWRVNL